MKPRKKLVLLDAHAIIHRAFHALPDFATSAGEPTGALYGLVTMILRMAQDLHPDYVVACYDLPGKTFRHEAFEAYKGTRKKTDDVLISQLQKSRDVISAFGIPIYDHPGFEADDMLGTIVHQVLDSSDTEHIDIVIASGDMDTLQLVTDKRISVFTLRKGLHDTVNLNKDLVIERFGFAPELIPDYKGLRGDPSDNIAGVPGIGEKTATILIQKFGTLENLYQELHKDEKKFIQAGIKPRIINLLREHEDDALFSKTLATIRRDAPVIFHLPEEWKDSLSQASLQEIITRYEFRSLSARLNQLFVSENIVQDDANKKEFSQKDLKELGVAVWLLNSEITHPEQEDIVRMARTEDPEKARDYLFRELQHHQLDRVYEKIELPLIPILDRMQSRGIGINKNYFKEISQHYHALLQKKEDIIYDMAGQQFNIKSPKQLGEILFDVMKLNVKGLRKTAGGARSTRESELEKLKSVHPIIEEILTYRQLQKMLSTYIDNLPELADAKDRLHTTLIQTGTTTGRFSSQDPNLQNIPADDEFGKAIRKGFIASPQHLLVACDYSQIELRVAAILSQEPHFMEVFEKGGDIHTAVAERVFHVSSEQVTMDMRRRAKVINFGIIYGMGVRALKDNLGTDLAEAEKFYDQYFESFPGLRAYLESIKTFAYKNGYTETLFGRRRYFPALQSSLPYVRAQAERMAVNAPIQGTATADIIKLALIHVDRLITEKKWQDKVFPLLQVHDELLFEIHEDLVDEALSEIISVMEHVLQNSYQHIQTTVPLKVSFGKGSTWADTK